MQTILCALHLLLLRVYTIHVRANECSSYFNEYMMISHLRRIFIFTILHYET